MVVADDGGPFACSSVVTLGGRSTHEDACKFNPKNHL
jgi:hypothetical protein